MKVKISALICWLKDMQSFEVKILNAIILTIIKMLKRKLKWLKLESGLSKKRHKVPSDTWLKMLMKNNSLKLTKEKH